MLLFVSTLRAQNGPSEMPYQKLHEAAYFGDIQELRKAFGDVKTPAAIEKRTGESNWGILQLALEGHSYDVISLLVEYGYPSDSDYFDDLVPGLFPEDMMEIGKRFPSFKEKWGLRFLMPALQKGNAPIVEALVKLGMDLKPYANNYLLPAVGRRNLEYIKLMLQNGADPYKQVSTDFPGGSAVSMAEALHSADLLELLDTKKLHTDEIQQLRKEYGPPPNSPFPGIWTNGADGFSVIGLVLYPDGTGTFGAAMSIIAGAIIWNQTSTGVHIEGLALPGAKSQSGRPPANLAVDLAYQNGTLAFAKADHGILIKNKVPLYDQGGPTRPEPIFIRVQKALITHDNTFWIQINNRHTSIPISKLVEGAQALKYGGPVPQNILRWENFETGPIPNQALQDAADLIPYVKQFADPDYSQNGDQLYFNLNAPAVLEQGSAYTLFDGNSPMYTDATTSKNAVPVFGYALLASKPFSHGRNWLAFYLCPARESSTQTLTAPINKGGH